jgi:hypothetical protein
MTPRERVRKAVEHRQPDMVPLDLGSTSVTGIHVKAYAKLKKLLKVEEGSIRVCDPYQMLAEVQESVRRVLGIDTLGIQLPYTLFGFKNKNWKPWRMPDGTEVLVSGHFAFDADSEGNLLVYPRGDRGAPPSGKMPRNGYYVDGIVRQAPFKEDELDPKQWVDQTYAEYSDEDMRYLEDVSRWAYEETEYSIVGNFCDGGLGDIAVVPGPHITHPTGIRDPEEWYVSLATRKNYIKDIFGYQTELVLRNLGMYYEAVGEKIDIIDVSETDFGIQTGLFLSKEAFRELFKPFFQDMNDWIHENTDWKTFYHSCGSIEELLDDFIDMGVDIINPVQYTADGMDLGFLKNTYGDRITFWGGGIDSQRTLPFGTPEEVREGVIENMKTLSKNGGFVFSAIHNIQPDVPGKNLEAMFDTVGQFREYTRS